jgi:AraC-like DNA-binding protein
MKPRQRYTLKKIPHETVQKMRRKFFAKAGPVMQLMIDLFESAPNISFCVKDADGRIMHTNRYNVDVSGWQSLNDMLGYTSEELYPPEQASVYGGRDRQVMESGIPIIERIYGFVADRSDSLNCVTVRPVTGIDGKRIGTATIYWRAQQKMRSSSWYDPIRKAVVYLNAHLSEDVSIERLATIANYSPAQFRRLFTKLMGQSPSAYIANIRINNAKVLLKTTDKRISDIAVEVGFFDHSHFIRTFKKLVGSTPAEYRKSL